MGMPSINISFNEKARSVVSRGSRGVVAIIATDETITGSHMIYTESDIPGGASEDVKTLVKLALKGYVNAPKRVVLVGSSELDYSDALAILEVTYFDYLVVQDVETDAKQSTIATWIKAQRENKKLVKAILPNHAGDSEAIINYATPAAIENDVTYKAEVYAARIAGVIAGTPTNMSCTFAPLDELTDCTRLNKAERDAAIDAGKLILYHDGEKVKIARGVNSLTTTNGTKGNQYKKIKLVDAMDMIAGDIRTTAEDTYIGKFVNSFDNKCLLISAINQYLATLIPDGVISSGQVSIDIEANKAYAESKGVDVTELTDDEIKKYNTGDSVYLVGKVSLLDTMEEIELPITI